MTVTLGPLVVGAADPARVSAFWRTVLGDEQFDRLVTVEPEREPKVVKNRVHVDLYVRDVAPLLVLGARVVDDSPTSWTTLADPEGNEFCAFLDRDLDADPLAAVFAVCTDSARPAETAAWWAGLVGARLGPGPDGAPRYLRGCTGWPELVWKFVEVRDERVALNRWSWSVLAESEAGGLVAAGATVSERGWFVDPDRNEFSGRAVRAGRCTSGGG